ncbi:MAG: glycosyltransferase [Leptospiraceae bacterium]|nr:glycosyltransferase [Leptospiraceae bacterium]
MNAKRLPIDSSSVPTIEDYDQRLTDNPAIQRNESLMRLLDSQTDRHKPLVSIITVVYNGEQTIRETIESVLRQDYEPIEYIIIDGGSQDKTIQIIREYADRVALWLSASDHGISDAFNRGIALSRGKYIGLINADDWYEPDTVRRVVDTFRADDQIDLVCGKLQYWRDNRKDVRFPSAPEDLGVDMTINHPTTFVSRRAYELAGLFRLDYKYAMDYELCLRLKKHACPFISLDAVLANMRWAGTSDRNWLRGLLEMRRAQRDNFPGKRAFFWQFQLRFVRGVLGRALAVLGLHGILRFYRARISRFRREFQ